MFLYYLHVHVSQVRIFMFLFHLKSTISNCPNVLSLTNYSYPFAFFFPFRAFTPLPFAFGVFFPSLLGSNAFGLVLFSGLWLLLLLLLRLLERDKLLLLSFFLRVVGGDLLREGCHLGSFFSS